MSLFEGTINSNTYTGCVAQELLPKLPQHSVIIMDNTFFVLFFGSIAESVGRHLTKMAPKKHFIVYAKTISPLS